MSRHGMARKQVRYVNYWQWLREARERFGDDPLDWAFVCPSCGHVATVRQWRAAGASDGQIAFSCIGRSLGADKRLGESPGPCDYAGGGLFQLNPVHVEFPNGTVIPFFDFADGQVPNS